MAGNITASISGSQTPTAIISSFTDVNGSPMTSSSTSTAKPSKSSTTPPISSASSHHLSTGATAGIAIAAFIVGALLAIAVAMVLQRKRNRRPRGQYANPVTNANEKAPVTDLEYVFPQPKDDSSMRKSATMLFTQIDNHAENFYHGERVAGNGDLFSTNTRFFAIKKVICEDMLHAIDWDTQPDQSLLPSGVTAIARNMNRDLNNPANEAVWSTWRVSSAYLLANGHGEEERQQHVVGAYVERLEQQLQPFRNKAFDNQRQQDLLAICNLTASLGQLILSQPARWEMRWPSAREGTHRGGLTYFPSFMRLTDNKARKLDRPEIVIEAARMQ